MKRRIKKVLGVKFLSLCPRGANMIPTLLKEQAAWDESNFKLDLMTKADPTFDEKGLLTALAYPANRLDADGDFASREVVQEMVHGFAKAGFGLDLRHDNKAVDKTRAHVVENFVVQKGDARFDGLLDYHGKPVDATDGWGVIIKIEDADLRKKYRSGEWQGVSVEGRAEFEVIEKEQKEPTRMALTKEEMEQIATLIKTNNESLIKGIAEAKAPAPPPAPKPVNLMSIEDVQKHLDAARAKKLAETIDANDPDALEAHLNFLKAEKAAREANETPEEEALRLRKENAKLKAQQAKARRSSSLPPVEDGEESESEEETDNGFSKEEQDAETAGKKAAADYNKRNGYVGADKK